MKRKKILILNAHPRKDSLCDALAREYKKGAESNGYNVKFVNLRNIKFDPIMRQKHGEENIKMEKSLIAQQKLIKWCDHLVIITPMWWMGSPALLKGYVDRVFTSGFAFDYKPTSRLPFPKRLLKGRTARVIYTQGGPKYLTNTIGFDAFWKAFKYGILMFCGFSHISRTVFANVVEKPHKMNTKKWFKKTYQLGKKGK